MTAAQRLRTLLAEQRVIEAPGTFDVLSAALVAAAGFEVAYVGGLSVCASQYGLPDVGIVSTVELIEHARRIGETVSIPLIVDLDDGGGHPSAVRRTVQLAERAGIAAFHLEDIDATRGKHRRAYRTPPAPDVATPFELGQERILPIEQMLDNLGAALDARTNDATVIIGRTDVLPHDGITAAIDRLGHYAEAGCDLVTATGLRYDDIEAVSAAVPVPLIANLPALSAEQRQHLVADRVAMLFYPTLTFTTAVDAVWRHLMALHGHGAQDQPPSPSSALATAAYATGWWDWIDAGWPPGASSGH